VFDRKAGGHLMCGLLLNCDGFWFIASWFGCQKRLQLQTAASLMEYTGGKALDING